MELALRKHRDPLESSSVDLSQTKDVLGFLGPGVQVEGQITAGEGSFSVNSQFKGTLRSQGTITVGDQAQVESDIDARVVRVMGKVKGSIRATEALEIKEHGMVQGDITTPVLLVEPGGCLEGQCHMPQSDPSDAPKAPVGL